MIPIEFINYQRELLLYFLFFILIIVFICLLLLTLFQSKDDEKIKRLFEILVVLLLTGCVIFADNHWIYVVYIFILGPRIASENYLIQLIKAWKTTRKEERRENVTGVTLEDKAAAPLENKYLKTKK